MEAARQRRLEDLCRRFRPALVAYFLRRVPDPAEAEDLAHDVLLRLAGIPLEQMRSADAYVFQVAANLLKDRARRSKVRAAYVATEAAWGRAEELETRSFDPERIEAARRSLSALVNRLRELPPTILRLFSDTSTTAPSGLTTWDEAYLKSIYGMTEPMQLPRAYIAHSMVSQIVP